MAFDGHATKRQQTDLDGHGVQSGKRVNRSRVILCERISAVRSVQHCWRHRTYTLDSS